MSDGGPSIGVVVIGRDEGERLGRCLASVAGRGFPVVYADSGSRDGSPEVASRAGVDVVVLDNSRPHTAARGRNAGFARLDGRPGGAPEFVQFVDGDSEIAPDWLRAGAAWLACNPRLAIVTGHLREKHRESSIYARLCDMEWQGPIGPIESCGGLFMVRASAFRQVGGFVEGIAAGEEPDLCARLRAAGWSIARIDAEMGVHDAAMTRFGQWWRRAERTGYYSARAAARGSAQRSTRGLRRLAGSVAWSVGLPALVVGAAVALPGRWAIAAGAAAGAAYALQAWRIYRHRRRAGNTPRDARLYSLFCLLGKWPETVGQARFWVRTLRGADRPSSSAPGPSSPVAPGRATPSRPSSNLAGVGAPRE
jgi:GT2 family glycosyltransferase